MWLFTALANQRELMRDFFPNKPKLTEENLPNLSGKVYVVTGATAGIGYETARLLLLAGAKVWVTGRTSSKLREAERNLAKFGPVRVLQIKLEDPATIAEDIKPLLDEETRLDGIVHNAGMTHRDGQFACGWLEVITVNVLGPWVLQSHLDSLILATAKSAPKNSVRIVWVASGAHYLTPKNGGIYWQDLNSEAIKGPLGFGVYGHTKTMNMYQASTWADAHKGSNVISLSVHPGAIKTDIRRYNPEQEKSMLARMSSPAVFGAYAEIAPLLDPKITMNDTGDYYRPFGEKGRIRPDIKEAMHGQGGERFYKWINTETAKIVNSGPQGTY